MNMKLLSQYFLLEIVHSKIFRMLSLASFLLIAASPLISSFFGRSPEAVSIDMSLSIVWMSVLFYIVFYASQELSTEKNKAKISMMMSRPISYEDYIASKTISLTMGSIILVSILFVSTMILYYVYPFIIGYETRFELNVSVIALSFVSCFLFSIGTISFTSFVSSKVDTTLFVVAITIAYMLICNGIPVVIAIFDATGIHSIVNLLNFIQILFPDYSATIGITELLSLPLGDKAEIVIQYALNCLYIFVYSIFMLSLSYLSYKTKEIL